MLLHLLAAYSLASGPESHELFYAIRAGRCNLQPRDSLFMAGARWNRPPNQSTNRRNPLRHIAIAALILNLSVAGVYAQQGTVTMTFSGTAGPSAINLQQPNTSTGEQNLTGNSALGSFTVRIVRATATSPQPSSDCSGLYIPTVAGAGLFRFDDGSLLKVNFTQGGDCIDVVHMVGHCTMTFQIAGGTGRFTNASGVLTLTETALPVLADASNHTVLFTEAGGFTGEISGMATEEESQDMRRR